MRSVQWFAAVVVGVASLPLLAQQAGASGQQSTSVSAGQTHVNDSSSANANGTMGRGSVGANGSVDNSAAVSGTHGYAAADMRPVNGELQSRLDAKSAKTGDQVVVKTTEKFKTADGTEIPKGTRLIGHVTEVQAHTKGQAQSQLGIAFDRAELKGGQSFAIHSVIDGVSLPVSAMAAAGADESSDAMMGGGAAMAGGANAGSGIASSGRGVVGGAVSGVGDTAGRVGSRVDAAADSTMNATGRVAANTTGMVDGTAHAAAGASGSLAAHVTSVPGVMLRGDATGSASGTLSATGKNVQLESGTQMMLRVAKQ